MGITDSLKRLCHKLPKIVMYVFWQTMPQNSNSNLLSKCPQKLFSELLMSTHMLQLFLQDSSSLKCCVNMTAWVSNLPSSMLEQMQPKFKIPDTNSPFMEHQNLTCTS